jgi:ABC-type transporter MlaC component
MRIAHFVVLGASLAALSIAAPAHASPAESFLQQKHETLEQLLHQPASPGRDAQVNQQLDAFVDYDELARRAFGEPCPASLPGCEDLWASYSDAQKGEVKDLLRQLVEKSYRKNLMKTLDYEITYKGERDAGGETRVLTEAKNKTKSREPPVRVDYVIKQTPNGLRVVDIVTEGSVLTKNYYDQFLKKMHNPDEGYTNIVQKLRDKIAKKE